MPEKSAGSQNLRRTWGNLRQQCRLTLARPLFDQLFAHVVGPGAAQNNFVRAAAKNEFVTRSADLEVDNFAGPPPNGKRRRSVLSVAERFQRQAFDGTRGEREHLNVGAGIEEHLA